MLVQWLQNQPAFTRAWVALILACAVLVHFKLVLPGVLFYTGSRAPIEVWRFITGFCIFEGIGVGLLFKCYTILTWVKSYEEEFLVPWLLLPRQVDHFSPHQTQVLRRLLDDNQLIDFYWFIIQVAFSIVILPMMFPLLRNFERTGYVLESILQNICHWRHAADLSFVFGVFPVRRGMLPFMFTVANVFLTGEFTQGVAEFVTSPWSWDTFRAMFPADWLTYLAVVYLLSHFWWYTRHFLPEQTYSVRPLLRQKTFERYRMLGEEGNRRFIRMLLMPPWYAVFIPRIAAMPHPVVVEAELAHDDDNTNPADTADAGSVETAGVGDNDATNVGIADAEAADVAPAGDDHGFAAHPDLHELRQRHPAWQ